MLPITIILELAFYVYAMVLHNGCACPVHTPCMNYCALLLSSIMHVLGCPKKWTGARRSQVMSAYVLSVYMHACSGSLLHLSVSSWWQLSDQDCRWAGAPKALTKTQLYTGSNMWQLRLLTFFACTSTGSRPVELFLCVYGLQPRAQISAAAWKDSGCMEAYAGQFKGIYGRSVESVGTAASSLMGSVSTTSTKHHTWCIEGIFTGLKVRCTVEQLRSSTVSTCDLLGQLPQH